MAPYVSGTPSCCAELRALVGRYVVQRGMLAELQGADIGDDSPAVALRNLSAIGRHGAKAVGRYLKQVSRSRRAQAVAVKGCGTGKTALDNHAVAVAGAPMAGRTIDVIALLPTQQHRLRHGEWKSSR